MKNDELIAEAKSHVAGDTESTNIIRRLRQALEAAEADALQSAADAADNMVGYGPLEDWKNVSFAWADWMRARARKLREQHEE